MIYLVSYDITDNRRRTRLAKALKDFGDRVQYSVFECLLDKGLRDKMEERIVSIICQEEDNVRIYSLCAACEKAITIIGQGERTKDEEVYIL